MSEQHLHQIGYLAGCYTSKKGISLKEYKSKVMSLAIEYCSWPGQIKCL